MRSDYALYIVAVIFFILTVMSFAVGLAEFERNLSVVATAVLGLLFIGLGYTQKPKPKAIVVEAPPSTPAPAPPQPTPAHALVTEVKKEEKAATVEVATPSIMQLTEVEGIGEKRSAQLRALGISNVENLTKASAKDLATKLKISPKITGKWIENAKKLLEKS